MICNNLSPIPRLYLLTITKGGIMYHKLRNDSELPAEKDNQKKVGFAIELFDYNIEKILYNFHQVFLYGAIDEKMTPCICEELVAMDAMNQLEYGENYDKYIPITLRIWSPGGYVTGGLAIIDTMTTLKTPIITMVTGQAASMASIITLTGDVRLATKNSDIMFHPMRGGVDYDYLPYEKDQMAHTERSNKRVLDITCQRTKLGQKRYKKILDKAENGELWLNAEEAKLYGVIDDII